MRILQVSSATRWGGGEQHLIELTRGLVRRNHVIELALRPSSPLVEVLRREVPRIHSVPLRNSLDFESVFRLRGIVRARKIEIVHAHLGRDYLVCALALRNLTGPKLVLTRHHYLPTASNPFYRRLLKDVRKVIAVSHHVERVLRGTGWPAQRIVVINNWLSPERSASCLSREALHARWGLSAGRVIGSVGNLDESKGQQDLIQAASLVVAESRATTFVIAGEDTRPGRPTESRLRDLVARLGLERHVRLIARVESLHEFLSAVDVFVLPSRDEAFSLVLIEAMAAGLPVVATRVGGPAEIVKEDVTGLLVPPRDPHALAKAVNRLLNDKDLGDRLGQNAKQDVESRFDYDRAIDQVESVYFDVLSQCPIDPLPH